MSCRNAAKLMWRHECHWHLMAHPPPQRIKMTASALSSPTQFTTAPLPSHAHISGHCGARVRLTHDALRRHRDELPSARRTPQSGMMQRETRAGGEPVNRVATYASTSTGPFLRVRRSSSDDGRGGAKPPMQQPPGASRPLPAGRLGANIINVPVAVPLTGHPRLDYIHTVWQAMPWEERRDPLYRTLSPY